MCDWKWSHISSKRYGKLGHWETQLHCICSVNGRWWYHIFPMDIIFMWNHVYFHINLSLISSSMYHWYSWQTQLHGIWYPMYMEDYDIAYSQNDIRFMWNCVFNINLALTLCDMYLVSWHTQLHCICNTLRIKPLMSHLFDFDIFKFFVEFKCGFGISMGRSKYRTSKLMTGVFRDGEHIQNFWCHFFKMSKKNIQLEQAFKSLNKYI